VPDVPVPAYVGKRLEEGKSVRRQGKFPEKYATFPSVSVLASAAYLGAVDSTTTIKMNGHHTQTHALRSNHSVTNTLTATRTHINSSCCTFYLIINVGISETLYKRAHAHARECVCVCECRRKGTKVLGGGARAWASYLSTERGIPRGTRKEETPSFIAK